MAQDGEVNVNLAQLREVLTQGIAAADPTRAAGLATLLRLTQARDAGLQREQQRLGKLRPADDPRLASIASRLAAGRALGERVSFEARRADTGLDKVDPKAWTLQGLVFVKDETWLKGKAVALFDAAGAVVDGTETELDGNRFVIRYVARAADPATRAPQEVFAGVVGVDDRRKRALFLDTRPLQPQNGRITYVEINVGATRPDSPTPRPPSPTEPDERPRPAPVNPIRPRPVSPRPTPPPLRPAPASGQPAGPRATRGTSTDRPSTGSRRSAGGREPPA